MEFKGTKGKWYTRGKYVTSDEEDICEVFLWDDPLERDEETTEEEAKIVYKANSKLITHAPEMLEMLIELRDDCDGNNFSFFREKLEALIKSATEVDNGN